MTEQQPRTKVGKYSFRDRPTADVTLSTEDKRQQAFHAEIERPLTLRDIESLRASHGTYDPGQGYFTHMGKVFDAAEEKAAATPAGRRTLARRDQATELEASPGTPAKEILEFADELDPVAPGSTGWNNLIETWSEIWKAPREHVEGLDAKMRAATGEPDRSELVGQRKAITAQIDAMDVNDAAAGILARYPTAAKIEARTTGEDEDVVWAEVRDAAGTLLTAGDADDPEFFTEFDRLSLVPNKYRASRSPLRNCTADNDEKWTRRYDLNKMAALTAADLMEK